MPVPKKRRSKGRRRIYHAYFRVFPQNTSNCPNCGQPFLAHKVCPTCGFYKGKKVMVTKTEKSADRKAKKKEQEKEKTKK